MKLKLVNVDLDKAPVPDVGCCPICKLQRGWKLPLIRTLFEDLVWCPGCWRYYALHVEGAPVIVPTPAPTPIPSSKPKTKPKLS